MTTTTTVLLFVEHELDERDQAATVRALADLAVDGERPVGVTVLVPYRTDWPAALMGSIAVARGSGASWVSGDARHEAALVRETARRVLRHVLWTVRSHGHVAGGELVPVRDAVRDLATEAAARQATTALVVCSPHRVAHLVHRDFEHRLRRSGVVRVVQVSGQVGGHRHRQRSTTSSVDWRSRRIG